MPAHSTDLASLVRSCAHGDRESFGRLYDLTSARVFGVALGVLDDEARAEEVTRSSMVEAWRTAPSYDASRASVLTWLLTLTHRAAVARKRADAPGAPLAVSDNVLRLAYFDALTHTEIELSGHLPPGCAADLLRAQLLMLHDRRSEAGADQDLLPAS